jgi:predicted outer membrane repeat protein
MAADSTGALYAQLNDSTLHRFTYGGGAYASDTRISGGQFVGNSANGDAGGLGSGPLVISGTLFRGNTADGYGGGLYAEGQTILQGVQFVGNHATLNGGAVRTTSRLTVTASAFIDNRADSGGALQASDGWLANVLFAGNVATSTQRQRHQHLHRGLDIAHLTVAGTGAGSRAIVLQARPLNTIISGAVGLERRGGTAGQDYPVLQRTRPPQALSRRRQQLQRRPGVCKPRRRQLPPELGLGGAGGGHRRGRDHRL